MPAGEGGVPTLLALTAWGCQLGSLGVEPRTIEGAGGVPLGGDATDSHVADSPHGLHACAPPGEGAAHSSGPLIDSNLIR